MPKKVELGIEGGMSNNLLAQLQDLLYTHLDNRAEAIWELLIALSGNEHAASPVELSLHPLFQRQHSSVYAAIHAFVGNEGVLRKAAGLVAPRPQQRTYWRMSVDATAHPRPYARTLPERQYVHAPTPTPGQKPVTVGHAYSSVMLLPERTREEPPWVIPLDVRRVRPDENVEMIGAEMLCALLQDEDMPWHGELTAIAGDVKYSQRGCLLRLTSCSNAVPVVRVRSNRVFYRKYVPPADAPPRPGHPRWYGERFALNDPATWPTPDALFSWEIPSTRGEVFTVTVHVWQEMLMRGRREEAMHTRPFTLLRVEIRNASGRKVHRRPMWLILFGPRRQELTPKDAVETYFQRFDHEHFLRFGKQRLLLTKTQTPDADREAAWWRLAFLAYLLLWAARPLAQAQWRPWERRLPAARRPHLSPTQVQRDFSRIITALDLLPPKPKPRGKPSGWPQGQRRERRPYQSVVKKKKKAA